LFLFLFQISALDKINNKMENKTETRVFKCKCCGSYNEIKYRSDETQIRQLPEGLESFLMDLTVSLLKQNPSDLSQMTHLAYKYFSCKAKNLTESYDSENMAFLSSKQFRFLPNTFFALELILEIAINMTLFKYF
jgi:hypothetical protein